MLAAIALAAFSRYTSVMYVIRLKKIKNRPAPNMPPATRGLQYDTLWNEVHANQNKDIVRNGAPIIDVMSRRSAGNIITFLALIVFR